MELLHGLNVGLCSEFFTQLLRGLRIFLFQFLSQRVGLFQLLRGDSHTLCDDVQSRGQLRNLRVVLCLDVLNLLFNGTHAVINGAAHGHPSVSLQSD